MAKQKAKRQAIQTDVAGRNGKRGCIGNLAYQLRTLSLAGWVVLCGGFFVLGQIGQMQQAQRAPTQTVQALTLVAMAADLTATESIREFQIAIATVTGEAQQTATATLWTKTPTPTITYTPSVTNTPLPTNTATATSSNTPPTSNTLWDTNTPAPVLAMTRIADDTFYAVTEGARARACPQLTCDVVVTLAYGDDLTVIGSIAGDTVSGDNRWWIADGGGRTVYIHSSLMSRTRPAQQQAAPPVSGSGSTGSGAAPSVPRPRYCATAVAMGYGAAQIAQTWPHLDRDKDGVACYGE